MGGGRAKREGTTGHREVVNRLGVGQTAAGFDAALICFDLSGRGGESMGAKRKRQVEFGGLAHPPLRRVRVRYIDRTSAH